MGNEAIKTDFVIKWSKMKKIAEKNGTKRLQ